MVSFLLKIVVFVKIFLHAENYTFFAEHKKITTSIRYVICIFQKTKLLS